jgi:hypothetical protein
LALPVGAEFGAKPAQNQTTCSALPWAGPASTFLDLHPLSAGFCQFCDILTKGVGDTFSLSVASPRANWRNQNAARPSSEQAQKFVATVAALDAANTRSGNERQNGHPVAHAGQQVRTVFLTERDVLKTLRSYRAGMPDDIRLVGCSLTREGAFFTIRSEAFRPLAEGELIPEQMPKYGRAP